MQTLQQRKVDLSIIVPVYNLEHYISPLIRSLIEQNIGIYEVEYIFVLNKCTDESERVIREEGKSLNPIIINCEYQGCGNARNEGYEIAKGGYVWFMDGDDWLTRSDAVKDVLDKAYDKGLDILRIPFDSNSFNYNYFSMVWQYLFRKGFIEEFRFSHIQPCEDDEFMVKVLNKAGYSPMTFLKMPHLNKVAYHYNYMREGSNMYRHFQGEDINGESR